MYDQAKLFCTTIAVESIDEARTLFTSLLGFKAPEAGPLAAPKPLTGGHAVKYGFFEKDGSYIELVEPTSGPRLEMIKQRGPGPYMLCFTVPNIHAAYTHFEKQGIPLLDPAGNRLESGKLHMSGTGSKCFFLYLAGVYMEFLEEHIIHPAN